MGELSKVQVAHGGADEFWDVYFTPLQASYADAAVDDDMSRPSISVHLDPEDGSVSLNAGYAEGSKEREREDSLWNEFQDPIVSALVDEIRTEDGPFEAFFADAAAKQQIREDGIRRLEHELAAHELDLEDEDEED
jgi:hypothetical protein